MKNIKEGMKHFVIKFLDILMVLLCLIVGLSTVYINGVFISNIINSLRLTGYIDFSIGIQIVLVYMSLVWIPIYIFHANKR